MYCDDLYGYQIEASVQEDGSEPYGGGSLQAAGPKLTSSLTQPLFIFMYVPTTPPLSCLHHRSLLLFFVVVKIVCSRVV